MKTKILLLLFLVPIAPFSVASEEERTQADIDREISLLTTCEEAISYFHSKLGDDSKALLESMERDEMGKFHFSTGRGIRNQFGLWAEDSPIRQSCAKDNGLDDMRPDEASHYMIERIWDKQNEI